MAGIILVVLGVVLFFVGAYLIGDAIKAEFDYWEGESTTHEQPQYTIGFVVVATSVIMGIVGVAMLIANAISRDEGPPIRR